MGGGIDGKFGISSTLSSQQSSDLEKTRSELRQTFSAAEKYRQELEFLQKGGNPLDLKPQSSASVSVHSTGLTNQHPEQFVTSDVKGSFAVTASTHGDSVGSSVRLGVLSVCEPNSADNLMLTDGDNKFPEVERKSIAPLEHFSQLDSGQNARESDDSAALELPKKSYKRRIRSRPNHDGVRSISSDANVTMKNLVPNSLLDTELDSVLAVETTLGRVISTNGSRLCTPNGQNLDVNNENELPTSPRNIKYNGTGTLEKELASNEVSSCKEVNNLVKEKECKMLSTADNNLDSCFRTHNEDGSTASETACNVLVPALSVRSLTDISEQSACSQNSLNLVTKEHEDYILKEAHNIEAKRKTIAESSSANTLPLQNHQNSHWDLVLEEMSWLANDFAQERLWKVTAAAHISRRVAFTSQIRCQQQNSSRMQKLTAQTMCRAVMEFWQTIEVKFKDVEPRTLKTDSKQGLQGYAMRFMEYNSTHVQRSTDQVPPTPDVISDVGIIDIACDDNLTQENLFFMVPPGAVEAYKKSIESHLLQCETAWSGMQEEVDTSFYDAIADNVYEEDDEETRACYFPGAFEGSKASKATKKRRKNFKFYTARSYETGSDFPFMQSNDKNSGTQPSLVSGKRPGSRLNFPLPIKNVRTAFGQRVVGPFSGDINSFRGEQGTLHGGAQLPNNLEDQSTSDYEKQLQLDSVEVSDRRKRKKSKHPGSSFDHQWQLDSNFQNDQKDHSIRRLEAHQLDSNGRNGLSFQHNTKKQKIRQSFDHFTPVARSIPSPISSPEMSNMSNPKKYMESLVQRKSKTLKIFAGQPGSGSPWSLFEDQSLVVLVHDMGPNWELISDAINSNLQFKCIVRSSKECKERHKILMDSSSSDAAADSAQDSGLPQPYPSTLPGIPEGSARQLFQRLQGPMEEATLKSNFEKIIAIGQKQYRTRKQNENQDPKQLQQPHSSHTLALSQVSPNNLNGGPVLTPLDLYDAIASTPDVPTIGYQSYHSGSLPILNHGNGMAVLPGSSSSSSNLPFGNDLSSASVPLNPSMREARYGIPKMGLLPKDDQQRMQQYNQMLSARNMHLSPGPGSLSGSGRGVVGILPNGNNLGVMSTGGMNRGITSFHGFSASPSMTNMHSRAQGSSMLRPRNSMHLMRPNQNSNHQRQISQISQSQSSQGVPQFATNTSRPAFGMRFANAKERQQQQFATSNLMVSQENSTQKHSLLPPHGLMLNPQTGGNQILKQQHINNRLLNSTQMQAAKLQHQKPDNSNHQKLVNLSQPATTQKLGNSRLLVNSTEPHTSKLQIPPPQTSSAGASS